jgi:hypothetical protein
MIGGSCTRFGGDERAKALAKGEVFEGEGAPTLSCVHRRKRGVVDEELANHRGIDGAKHEVNARL